MSMSPESMTDQELATRFREAYVERCDLLKEMNLRKFQVTISNKRNLSVGQLFMLGEITKIAKTETVVL